MFTQDEKSTDTKNPVISRRQVLKAIGAGSALVACSAFLKDGIPTYETYAASDKKQQQDQQGEDNKRPIASHNDLANRDEVAAHPASAILDASNITQQQVNDGLESIADLLAITNPQNGSRVFVKSYHAGLNKGGGHFVYDSTKSSINNKGTIINGWVRITQETVIRPEWFGAVGDGITDDWQALTDCFQHHFTLTPTLENPNAIQHQIPSLTFLLSDGLYRITQPLVMPARGKVISEGIINYFPRNNLSDNGNRATIFYDGISTDVAAVYLPVYKLVDGVYTLIADSKEFFNFSAGIIYHTLARGGEWRFNIITKPKTKIGFNSFGAESGKVELGIGTMGTPIPSTEWSSYAEDDYSPLVGIVNVGAWNSSYYRCRILAHSTGIYCAGSQAKTVIRECYINRQVSTAESALTQGLTFTPPGVPVDKTGLTAAIVLNASDISVYDTVTEGWGCPYVISGSYARIFAPHIEGSNKITQHNFLVYNSKIDVHAWNTIRTMYAREGTSLVYSSGMRKTHGDYFKFHGAGYYGDNSLFNLVDGTGYDAVNNWEFLSIENVPYYKLIGGCWATDLRYINKISGFPKNSLPLNLDATRKGLKGIGAYSTVACQSFSDINEAIRILGDAWDGTVNILKDITVSAPGTYFKGNRNEATLKVAAGATLAASGASLLVSGVNNLSVTGSGTLSVTSPLIRPQGNGSFGVGFTGNTITGISALVGCDDFIGTKNITVYSGNLSAFTGNYAFSTTGGGHVNLSVQATTRDTSNEIANRRVRLVGHSVNAYFKNNLPSVTAAVYSTSVPAQTQAVIATLTLTGVSIGDVLQTSYNVATSGLQLRAEVTSANTITVFVYNSATSSTNLDAGNVTVRRVYFDS